MLPTQIEMATWVLDWRQGPPPNDEQEYFNCMHSSIHNVIECRFGVWKGKWIFFQDAIMYNG
jgi:hypothetical protein